MRGPGGSMTVLRPPLVLSAKEAKRLVADAHGAELTVELSMPRLQWPALAKALGAAPRPHITALTVRCLEGAPVVAPGRPMISGKANHALWDALPNLQELTLVGHALAAELAHEGLTSLSMEGFSLTKSLSKADADLPSLTTLVWAFGGDEHGVAVGPSALKGLFKGTGTPRLTDVDLGSADIDGDLLRSPTFVKGTLLPRLRRFVFPMGALDDAGFAKQHEALAGLQSIVLVGDELGSDDPRITRVHRLTPASVHPIGIDAHLAWGLGDEQVAATVEALTTRTVRQFLTGAHDVCQQAGALGAGLAAHAELEHLDLSRPLTRGLADQAGAFFAALGPHPSLATVELFRNHLQGQLGALGEAAARWPALRSLDVGMTRTEAEDLSALFAGLARSSTLQRLQAGANRQGPEVDEAWASLRSTSLTELRAIRMGCGGLASLHDRLPALTRLDVTTTPKAEPIDGAALAVALDGRPMDRVAFELAVSDHGVDGLAQLLAAVPVRELHLELEEVDVRGPGAAGAVAEFGRVEAETVRTLAGAGERAKVVDVGRISAPNDHLLRVFEEQVGRV